MIEQLDRSIYTVTCDGCGAGEEVDAHAWDEMLARLGELGWACVVEDGDAYAHLCPECKEGLE